MAGKRFCTQRASIKVLETPSTTFTAACGATFIDLACVLFPKVKVRVNSSTFAARMVVQRVYDTHCDKFFEIGPLRGRYSYFAVRVGTEECVTTQWLVHTKSPVRPSRKLGVRRLCLRRVLLFLEHQLDQ